MFQQVLLCFTGFCAGIIVAGGVSGLLIGLSIVPRYAGITHTANHIFLYVTSGNRCRNHRYPLSGQDPTGTFFPGCLRSILRNFPGWLDPGTGRNCKSLSRFRQTPETHPGTFSCDHIHCCRKNFWLSFLLCHGLDVNFTALHHLTKGFFICVILTKKNTNSMSNSLPQPTVFL